MVIGEQPVFRRKLNKKGIPVGKAVLTGFTLEFNMPLAATAVSNPGNYELDTVTIKKVKKSLDRVLHPIKNFTVKLHASERFGDSQARRRPVVPDRRPDHGVAGRDGRLGELCSPGPRCSRSRREEKRSTRSDPGFTLLATPRKSGASVPATFYGKRRLSRRSRQFP